MNTTIDLDALVIDGTKLRQAREERGLSVAEVAALCTLSREQVQHIEDGGVRPFYTPAHKLLAIRKYAAAMGVPYDDIVTGPGADDTMPVPADAPPSLMVHGEGEEATDLRLAAVERNAEIRRKILIGAITATIVLAFYAKMRGAPDNAPELAQPVVSEADAEIRTSANVAEPAAPKASAASNASAASAAPAAATAPSTATAPPSVATASATPATNTTPPSTSAASATAAAAPASQATATPAAPAAGKPAAAASTTAAAGTTATASPTAAAAAAAAPAAATATASDNKLAASEACTSPATGDLKTWTPIYQRKADTRLFLISAKETTVCVHDASGKAALLKLKARAGQAYSGKPPYVVQSPQLSELEIYLQGMRARIPPQAPALRLQVTPVTAPDAG